MRRKLVKQGPATLTVSMPAEWVRTNNLKPGQEVELNITNNNVIIASGHVEEQGQTITIDVHDFSKRMLSLLFSAAHKKGYDEIRLRNSPEQLAYIEERVAKNLLGYEIIAQNTDGVTVRFVTRIDAEELPTLTRRVFLVTLSLAEGIVTKANARELLVLEETNNRLTNYCERILLKHNHTNANMVFEYLIVWILEKIADEYKDIILHHEIKRDEAQIAYNLLKEFYELYYKYSYSRHDLLVKHIEEEQEKLVKRQSPFVAILHLLDQAGGSIIGLQLE